MLAMQTQTPELAMSEMEGDQFMKAAQKVLRHYNIEAQQKTIDWVAFMSCVAQIYGTRAIAIAARRKQEAAKNKPASAEIHPFPNLHMPPNYSPPHPEAGE